MGSELNWGLGVEHTSASSDKGEDNPEEHTHVCPLNGRLEVLIWLMGNCTLGENKS